jgi:hypothetical protein
VATSAIFRKQLLDLWLKTVRREEEIIFSFVHNEKLQKYAYYLRRG